MSKRLVKGTNSLLDGKEADFGPLLPVYKIEDEGLKVFLSHFRELQKSEDKNISGIYVEDGYLIDIENPDFDQSFQHGKFIKEYCYQTPTMMFDIVQFSNILQVVINSKGKVLYSAYKRPLYLSLLCSMFEHYSETDKIETVLQELEQLL